MIPGERVWVFFRLSIHVAKLIFRKIMCWHPTNNMCFFFFTVPSATVIIIIKKVTSIVSKLPSKLPGLDGLLYSSDGYVIKADFSPC